MPNDVTRYSIADLWLGAELQRDQSGEWVHVEDYDVLEVEVEMLRKDCARMDWLSQQEMGIKDRGYGDYWYYTGEGFTPLRELCDQEIAGDAARIKEDADD